jgi:hypothetical protein
MTSNSNTNLYSTLTQNYDIIQIPSGTATASNTLVTSGTVNASIITDILVRSASAGATIFEVIICNTGSQSTSFPITQVSIPAGSGNSGSTSIASIASIAPLIFDLDLAGNRVICLESGQSIYLRNVALTAGLITVTSKRRNY